jgi:hypothetical protein
MQMEVSNYTSKGQGALNTVLGSIGTAGALGVLNGGLGGIFGGNCGGNCSENQLVNRYEAGQNATISELRSQIALRDSSTYTDSKLLDLYKYFDGELRGVRDTLGMQAVQNQKTADAFEMVHNDIVCCKNELYSAIARERDDRCCGDNAIVNYSNATFYPKMVTDVTTGTTTTAQSVYNPLPNCGRCCR